MLAAVTHHHYLLTLLYMAVIRSPVPLITALCGTHHGVLTFAVLGMFLRPFVVENLACFALEFQHVESFTLHTTQLGCGKRR